VAVAARSRSRDRAAGGRGPRGANAVGARELRHGGADSLAPDPGAAHGRACGRRPSGVGFAGYRTLGMTRRRRGVLLLGLAAVCAGLAASLVNQYANDVSAQVGPLQPVVVARRDVPRGTLVTPAIARSALDQRRVPLRFAPPRSLRAPQEALGYRTLASIAMGDYVGEAQLGTPRRAPRPHGMQGGRLVEVAVTGARTLAGALRPGALVDVLVTTDGDSGSPRTYLALQRVQLIDFRESSGTAARDGADATATVRVTLRQAVTLIAAQNFAREVRVVARPAGDERRVGAASVSAATLGR
jgi:pilus assembly protein CpaB